MKIAAVNQISFKRSLRSEEIKDYSETLRAAKNLAGQSDKTIFIMPSSCLPQSTEFNSGIGHISSDISQDYFKYMKDHIGLNIVEDLPAGQVRKSVVSDFYCAYTSTAFELGNHQINPELLVTDEFEHLLDLSDIKALSESNKSEFKDSIVNYKNVMEPGSSQDKVLQKAFNKFQTLSEDSSLKKKYNKFVLDNSQWLDIPRERETNKEFFKFKQFLADEHLRIGKTKLNEKGIKLYGDCPIVFSPDEIKAFPNAFKKDCFVGSADWRLPSLDFDSVLNPASDAYKVLKQKVQLCAKRYDGIRFDVGWCYFKPLMIPDGADGIKPEYQRDLGDKLVNLIEDWVKEVKGRDFDLKNLIYEVEAGPESFQAFQSDGQLIPPLRDRVKVYSNTYMHSRNGDNWGYNQAFVDRGWNPDMYVLGVGNHDMQPLKQIAKDIPEQELCNGVIVNGESHKKDAITALTKVLDIPEADLQKPEVFAKAKWAETMSCKNTHMFYMDVFGREERFDMQSLNNRIHPDRNYAYKVPTDYKSAYQKGVKEGFGFNPMDALEKAFKAKGLDKTNPQLYGKIVKYKKILLEEENTAAEIVKTQAKKNKNKIYYIAAGAVVLLGGLIYILKDSKTK